MPGARRLAARLALGVVGLGLLYRYVRYLVVEHSNADLWTLVAAGERLARGDSLYGPALAFGVAPSWDESGAAPYVYPPLLAYAFMPLWSLDHVLLGAVWQVALQLTVVGLWLTLWREMAPRSTGTTGWLVGLLLLGFWPLQLDLSLGQLDVPLVLLAVGAARVARGGHPNAAGLLLAAAVLVKPIFGALVVWLAWKREWRAARVAVLASVVGLAIAFAPLGIGGVADYLSVLGLWARGPFATWPNNLSPTGLALRLFTDGWAEPALACEFCAWAMPRLASMAAWLWFAFCLPRRPLRETENWVLDVGLALGTLLVVSPLAEEIHYVWLLPALAALGLACWQGELPWAARLAGGLAIIGLSVGYPYNLAHSVPGGSGQLLGGLPLYGLLVVLALLGWRHRRAEARSR